ncbi:pimeloyl-ACP methyl ester carboxylesterase [Lutibacter sp. Hel_I_33_5]|uniref:alpha/beta hydrolase n=1 Tax=Lutibacter sp. Hel_I_33_5 TaxID=1566289 RepID=UPI0011A944CF|nr:alpha/beta fold hydrolase [Lutibacter sp. Hel_I_33_5]TVZ57352.1 pimeloyl-ACP methyl ester carboxylesterase [Lutibacter sp. Hel_I_33_5]
MSLNRNIFLIFFLIFSVLSSNAQNVFSHEKEITPEIDFSFSEINFHNSHDNLWLSGTLITPKTDYKKIVVIVPGSGKDTRNSHYKLTKKLLKNNIAVYRFDERGVGKSEGKFTSNILNLTHDVAFAINHLKSVDTYQDKQIGLLGHSLGGMAAVTAYTILPKSQVDFLIQIASPVKNFADASKYQIKTLEQYQIKNKTYLETINLLDTLLYITHQNKNLNITDTKLRNKGLDAIKLKGFNINDVNFWSNTHINLFKEDYEIAYKTLKIPTIYIIGSNDQYINPLAEVKRLKNYNNPYITVKVISNLNHYLTSGTLTNSMLYNIDKRASDTILNWIEKI